MCKRFWIYLVSAAAVALCILACREEESASAKTKEYAIIPEPMSMEWNSEGYLSLEAHDVLLADGQHRDCMMDLGKTWLEIFPDAKPLDNVERDALVEVVMDSSTSFYTGSSDYYELTVGAEGVRLRASTSSGMCMGVQTLRQLLMLGVQGSRVVLPYVHIADSAQYAYRGIMLDIARHFFGPSEICSVIDYAVLYKYNHLHLHLTDDQGWRIEIKSWPRLTEVGASSAVGGGKGGFLTQQEYAYIVQYAAERGITIVPEIDMPGHTHAALVAYPELSCDGTPKELYTGTDVGFSTLCTSRELTYGFVDDVIRELAAITPGPYIHIGGDESHATRHDDYVGFVERIYGIVRKYNKRMIGWEEVVTAAIGRDAVVQHWNNIEHRDSALRQGFDVIMSPASRVYLDMQYDSLTPLGLHWAGYLPVQKSYDWALEDGIDAGLYPHILGVEAPLWTETVVTLEDIQYMILPRMACVAEVGWSPKENRSWPRMKAKLQLHATNVWDKRGWKYHSNDSL